MKTDQRSGAQLKRRLGYFTIRDVAEMLGLPYATCFKLQACGKLPAPSTTCPFLRNKSRKYYTDADMAKIRNLQSK